MTKKTAHTRWRSLASRGKTEVTPNTTMSQGIPRTPTCIPFICLLPHGCRGNHRGPSQACRIAPPPRIIFRVAMLLNAVPTGIIPF